MLKWKPENPFVPQMEVLQRKAAKKNRKAGRLLRKMERELSKSQTDLKKVLRWQKKTLRFLNQGIGYLDQRQQLRSAVHEQKSEVHFNLKKIQERYVKKFATTSCVYRTTMVNPETAKDFHIKDVLDELSRLFTKAIQQVSF